MKYKAIIFDMDGTIIETEHIWHEVTRSVVEKRGIIITPDLDEELKLKLTGMSMKDACKLIKDITGIADTIPDLVQEKESLANQLYRQQVRFIEGFLSFHEKVVARGLPVGIATNAADETVAVTDEKLNLRRLFGEHIYNISMVARGKPDPALYLHAAEKMNVDPAECIAFEDSAHGVQAALGAGMYTVGITSAKCPYQIQHSHEQINTYHEVELDSLLLKKPIPLL